MRSKLLHRNGGATDFTAIGAFSSALLGFFDIEQKDYRQIHAHTVLGLADGTTRGGHLLEGHVRPTLELVLTESPAQLRRRFNATVGLALIDL